MISLADIESARARIADRVHRTPVMTATRLGDAAGVRLLLKCENFQKTGSFKARGALNRVGELEAARARGVITFSAGNHAQALAWASGAAGVPAVVVMPEAASRAKADASRGYGAEVVLHGANGLEALRKARELEQERGLTFVHPFDDELVAAGQGTVGLELLDQVDDLDAVVVPIGGGGLIAGMLVAIKERNPRIKVYGVEPRGAASMRASLDAGRAVQLDTVNTIADGLAAPMAGDLTYEVVRRYADDVVVVDDDAIASALRELLFGAKILPETAGATAAAAILGRSIPLREGARVAAVVSGGNIDQARLAGLLG